MPTALMWSGFFTSGPPSKSILIVATALVFAVIMFKKVSSLVIFAIIAEAILLATYLA